MAQPETFPFEESEIERSLKVLGAWTGSSNLSAGSRDRIRGLIKGQNLRCVPIFGAAAIFNISISTARGYLKSGVIKSRDVHKNGVLIFDVGDLESRYSRFRQERRVGRTVAQIGRLLELQDSLRSDDEGALTSQH